ncbi:CHASE2 domain-containing protein [Paraliomyxa miuraensis]|uniref:CHASE2 domain-containing protein n=1 Tax=Paraliomyxa miuraensis TaxID=376150 RepID=UPI00389AEEBC|nr:CHASE2 domain-containing protein [Paraliomyxa miuraensis]
MLVAALRSTRVPEAIDVAMRSLYYRVAASAETSQRVLLVEADHATVADDAPVWPAERRKALLARIAAGHPAAVVELDRARMFEIRPEDSPDPISTVVLEPQLDPNTAIVESLDAHALQLPRLMPVMRALDRSLPLTQELPIHYLSPTSRLPTISFQRIERGDVPLSVFQDKVIVLGLTSRTLRDPLPTPVGALTTPEIVSHALAMLADGRDWYQPSWLVRTLVLALVLIATALALWRTTPAQAVLRVAGIMTVLVLADLTCFVMSWVHWGIANEFLVVLTVMLANWYLTQQHSVEIMETVSEQLTEQLVIEPSATAPQDWFWRDMAELVRAYLRVDLDGVIAELPTGRWHLELRAFMGMTEAQIGERRRDVRRPPYRAAFLTQRIARFDRRFGLVDDHYTMVVPLAHQGRLYGMWMVCVPKDMELDGSEIDAMERLGTELGRSIAAMRRANSQGVPDAMGGADVSTRLTQLVEGVEALGEDKQQVVGTFEALPVGLLIADVWGHILQINAALREQLAIELPDGIPNNDLCAVLSKITGTTIKGVHDIMRTVVRAGKTCRLRPRSSEERSTTYVLMPMRHHGQGTEDELQAGGSATRLVLVAIPNDLESLDMLIRSA